MSSDGDRQYGDNARDETAVTLAGLIPKAGNWLGYRYDFGDMWDHDVEVEKVHRAGHVGGAVEAERHVRDLAGRPS